MLKVVIFDIDGTLLRGRLESAAFKKAFKMCYGITGINDDWSSYRSPTDDGIMREILSEHFSRPCRNSEVQRVIETYMLLLQGIVPEHIPGAQRMLETLNKRKDVGLALATGNLKESANLRLEKAGMWDYFRCGAFADDGNSKTAILGDALIKCHKLWPGSGTRGGVVYVGDFPADAVAAQTYGIHFIGINRSRKKFRGLAVDCIYSDYQKLSSFIASLEQLWNSEV